MRSLRLSFYTSLAAHALVLGSIVLGGLAWHEAGLPDNRPPDAQVITIVGIPDEPPAQVANASAPVTAPAPQPVSAPAPLATSPVFPTLTMPATPVEPPVPSIPASDDSLDTTSLAPRVSEVKPAAATAIQTTQKSSVQAATAAAAASPSTPSPANDGDAPGRPGGSLSARPGVGEIRARPDYRHNPEPDYPLSARRRRQEGLVVLRVIVTTKGRASRVELKQSSGFVILDEAAVRAVAEWEFEPARIGESPLESEIEVPVRFKIGP